MSRVLPTPDGPSSATTCPVIMLGRTRSMTSKDTPSRIWLPPSCCADVLDLEQDVVRRHQRFTRSSAAYGQRTRVEHAHRVVEQQADEEDHEQDRVHLGEPEMLVLVQDQRAEPALGARDALDHRDHRPADREVLAQRRRAPCRACRGSPPPRGCAARSAPSTRMWSNCSRGISIDHLRHRGDEERRHAEREQRTP